MSPTHKILFLFFLLLFPNSLFSQQNNYEFLFLTDKQGLSQNSVTSILKDRTGFMWFGTHEGLNRYDGYEFKIFRHSKNPNSLSNNYIRTIIEDNKGIIWIGTRNGLNNYNPYTGKFTNFSNKQNNINNNIFALVSDKKNNLWIGTGTGLFYFNTKKKTSKFFSLPDSTANNIYTNSIQTLLLDDNTLRIGTLNGLLEFDIKKGEIQNHYTQTSKNKINGRKVRAIIKDSEGVIWIGSENGISKIYKDKLNKIVIKNYKIIMPENKIELKDITSLCQIFPNRILIGTYESGLLVFNTKTEKYSNYLNNNKTGKLDKIKCSYLDNNGLLWIGTINNGIAKILNKNKLFRPTKIYGNDGKTVMFYSFLEDSEQKNIIWCGTSNGLIRYDKKSKASTNYYIEFVKDSKNTIRAISQLSNDILLIGTTGNGIYTFSKKTAEFKKHNFNSLYPEADLIMSFCKTNHGSIYISSKNAVYKYNYEKETYNKIPLESESNQVIVYSIIEINEHKIIAGTLAAGLYVINPKNKSYKSIPFLKNSENNIITKTIVDFHRYSKNELFITTMGGGLFRFNLTDNSYNFIESLSPFSKTVYSIQKDSLGNLWMGTNKGLLKYNPANKYVSLFDKADGLQSNEFNALASLKCSDGELFFGGVVGFNHFYSKDITENKSDIPLIFSNFKILNQIVSPGEKLNNNIILNKDISFTDSIVLTHKDYLFSFEFAGINYTSAEKLYYRYKLNGFDKNWIYTDYRNRVATYTNLNKGNYKFIVQVSDKYGHWVDTQKEISITIKPPWWRTQIFYFVVIISTVILLFIITNRLIRRSNREKEGLKRIVKEKTSELHKETEFRDSIINNANDGIIVINPTGNFMLVNSAFCKITGYSKEELLKMNFRDITPKKWIEGDEEELGYIRKGMSSVKEKEYITKDGIIISVRLSSTILDKDKILSIVADISERKAIEVELENYRFHLENIVDERTKDLVEAKEHAEKADKLKSAFLANMSHEIRTPLNAVLGFAQLLKDKDITDEQQEDFINMINRGGETLLKLIDDIIDLAKIEANQLTIEKSELSVNPILEDIHHSFDYTKTSLNKENIDLLINIPDESIKIQADKYRFTQVFNNLINNALKFTEKGYIEIGYKINKGTPLFFVKDTGPGIPKDKIKTIFNRFVKIVENQSKIYSGTGLGLSICKTIIEMHNGKIWAESELGKGTTMYFTIGKE